jgi:hypothetical protein
MTVVKFNHTNDAAPDRSNGVPARNAASGANTNATTARQTQNPGRIRRPRRKANWPSGSDIRDPVMR